MQKKLSKQNNSGFTLSEVLIAVAILIVLMGLAMIPITRHQRDLRQTELDAKAEIVYHAAQNKLSELLANGRISDCYAEDLQPLNNTPLDAAERKTSLHYVTSAAKTGEGSAAAAILPEDQVDRQLWDNHWVIELDPTSGSVYAVFYVFDGRVWLDIAVKLIVESVCGQNIGYFGSNVEFNQIRVRAYESFLEAVCLCFICDLGNSACSVIRGCI